MCIAFNQRKPTRISKNASSLALQMELEDILKDLDEWLFVVSPQLLVLELEYFSLLASKTWVHKQLLVSIDPPIHPQTMALF